MCPGFAEDVCKDEITRYVPSGDMLPKSKEIENTHDNAEYNPEGKFNLVGNCVNTREKHLYRTFLSFLTECISGVPNDYVKK